MAKISGLQLPEPFDFTELVDWPTWICRFESYRIVSELNTKNEALQIHTLIYTMGDQAVDVLKSL